MRGRTGLGIMGASVVVCWLATVIAAQAQAVPRVTVQAGYWTNSAIWSGGNLPQTGDDVTVTNAVTLDVSTPALNSFSNTATLTFAGWNTALTALVVTVNGTITHVAQSDTNGVPGVYGDWTPDNRIWIVCSNLTVTSGGAINANEKGYMPSSPLYSQGYGPGGGTAGGVQAGGSHGGGGRAYGTVTDPIDPGSGGGRDNNAVGKAGGGAIRIVAAGRVTVNGSITANGGHAGSWSGGGSGGSVLITCDSIDGGAGSLIHATGGTGCGAGAGGRMSIVFTNHAAQSGLNPLITISAAGGSGAELGTIYFNGTSFLKEVLTHSGQIYIEGLTSWSANSFVLSNGWVRFQPAGFRLNVANDVVIHGTSAQLETSWLSVGGNLTVRYGRLTVKADTAVTNPSVNCGGSLMLTNNGTLYAYSGLTNSLWPQYGALVAVTGNMTIAAGSWVYPYINSSTANGGGTLFRMNDLRIASGGGFGANGLGWPGSGYVPAYGPGRGTTSGAGGGYGGRGGAGPSGPGGTNYGTAHGPMYAGSGGAGVGGNPGGNGGGLIHIRAAGNVILNGSLTADGTAGSYWGGGGGSGGGILVLAQTFAGTATGRVSADGKNGSSNGGGGGGGGGGRIAIWYDTPEWRVEKYLSTGKGASALMSDPTHPMFSGLLSVSNAVTYFPSEFGTRSFLRIPPPGGTVVLLR